MGRRIILGGEWELIFLLYMPNFVFLIYCTNNEFHYDTYTHAF
jgi:hypothetical protein